MMYRDVNGKKGYRALQGASGKTYGNMKLLTSSARAAALADGIEVVPNPVRPAPTPTQLEASRKRAIRSMAQDRIVYHLFGRENDGERQEASTVIEIIDALTALAVDLVQAGVLQANEINPKLVGLRQKAVDMRQARQAASAAIQGGDDLATFKATLDSIIPEPAE